MANLGWKPGFMTWEYWHDMDGQFINTIANGLDKSLFTANNVSMPTVSKLIKQQPK